MRVLFVSVALAIVATAVPLAAQAVARHYDLNIPRQPLDAALKDFASQTGLQIARFAGAAGDDAMAGPLSGEFSVEDALKTLLLPTGFSYRIVNDKTIAIVEPDQAKGAAGRSGTPKRLNLSQTGTVAPPVQGTISPGSQMPEALEEIVVTAQKREERLQDVPQSVSVISAEALVASGATQFRDFANSIAGLSFSTSGAGYTQISLRGVTAGVDIGQTVGIYVDDVPFGSSAGFSAASQHTLDIGLFGVDRIEVLRGPQGTLYGASTMGGLIKYVTPLPSTTHFGIDAQAGLSSTRHGGMSYSGSAALNAPLSTDKAALRVTGFYSRDGGFIDNAALNDDDANSSDIKGGRLDLLLTPTEASSIRLTAFQQDIDRNGEGTVDYAFSGASPDGALGQRRLFQEPFDQRFRVVSGTLTYDFAGAQLTSISSWQTTDITYLQDLSPYYVPLLGLFGLNYGAVGADTEASIDKLTQEVRLASSGQRTVEWLVGAYYTDEDSDFAQEFALLDLAGRPAPNGLYALATPSTFEESAVFGDLTWHLTDRFAVTGGLRYAHNKQTFQQIGSGLLGLTAPEQSSSENVYTWLANARYRVSDHATGYVRFATGYRPGGPNVVAIDPGTGLPIASPTFDADRLKSYEIGYKASTADRRLSVELAGYFIDWNDMHVSVANGGFSAIGNARGGAQVRGAELTLLARPIENLTLTGAFAFQDAEMSQDEPGLGASSGESLPNVPRWTGALGVDFRLSDSTLRPTLGASVRYVDERMASFDEAPVYVQYRLPDYTTVDLRLGVSVSSVDVQFYARNLLDERGQLSAFNWRGTAMPALLQPRTIGISLSTRF